MWQQLHTATVDCAIVLVVVFITAILIIILIFVLISCPQPVNELRCLWQQTTRIRRTRSQAPVPAALSTHLMCLGLASE